jgi:YHS domain-containing protein
VALRRKRVFILCIAAAASVCLALPDADPAKPQINTDQGGLAIRGYDPVAYFIYARPVSGREEFSHEWKGARWLFMSREHLDIFKENPEWYAPRYGGYCAWAVSRDHKADTEPDAWTIHGDRLYLNYSKSVRAEWSMNMARNIRRADENWHWMLKELR